MVKLIVGLKGSGKTKRLVDELNQLTALGKNVVCIEPGQRLDKNVKYTVRLVNIEDYPVTGYQELLGFIAGISAKDFDLDELYIDSIYKVARSECLESLAGFLDKLDSFVKDKKFNATVMLSAEPETLPAEIKKYIV